MEEIGVQWGIKRKRPDYDDDNASSPVQSRFDVDEILSQLNSIFSNQGVVFTVGSSSEGKKTVKLVSNLCSDDEEQYFNSITLELDPDTKTVDAQEIAKCGQMSGTQIIQKLVEFAKKIHFRRIVVIDGSTINTSNCKNIDFPLLNLLSEGVSWYHKVGFRPIRGGETSYRAEKEHNEKVINNSFDFLQTKLGVRKYYALTALLNNTFHITTKGKTIRAIFTELKEKLKKENFREEFTAGELCETLRNLLVDLQYQHFLQYDDELEYVISQRGGGASKRRPPSFRRRRRHPTRKRRPRFHRARVFP